MIRDLIDDLRRAERCKPCECCPFELCKTVTGGRCVYGQAANALEALTKGGEP